MKREWWAGVSKRKESILASKQEHSQRLYPFLVFKGCARSLLCLNKLLAHVSKRRLQIGHLSGLEGNRRFLPPHVHLHSLSFVVVFTSDGLDFVFE